MKKLNNLLAYIVSGSFLFGLFLFAYFIFDHFTIGAVGFVMMLPFIVFIVKLLMDAKTVKDDKKKQVALLLKNGEKIPLNLLEADIGSNTWTETQTTAPSRIIAIDSLIGESHRHYKEVAHHRTSISFSIFYKGNHQLFSTVTTMDSSSLTMFFAMQKHTFLYIDKENPNNYHIDLSFLGEVH